MSLLILEDQNLGKTENSNLDQIQQCLQLVVLQVIIIRLYKIFYLQIQWDTFQYFPHHQQVCINGIYTHSILYNLNQATLHQVENQMTATHT